MAFSVKNRTNGELLRWARGRGRVMRGCLEMEIPSDKALGQTDISRGGLMLSVGQKRGFYPPSTRDFEPAEGLSLKAFWA
jgi:hypothetical protein